MVELARERAPGAEVVLPLSESPPFGEETFTAVAMSVVFFFLDDPLGMLGECRRVLRPGERPQRRNRSRAAASSTPTRSSRISGGPLA
jgi:ubiquinone/menaquinone biosynthesis C-methylase UbiE